RERITITRGRKSEKRKGPLLGALREIFAEHRITPIAGLPPFTAGAVGYFAYDFVRHLEKLPARAKDDLDLPDCVLMFFDRLLTFDHVRNELHIIATANVRDEEPRKAYDRALRDIAAIEKQLARGLSPEPPHKAPRGTLQVKETTSRERFLKSVKRVKDYIVAG